MSEANKTYDAKLFTPYGVGNGYEIDFTPQTFDLEMMATAIDQARLALKSGDNPVGAVLVNNHGKPDARQIYQAHSTEFSDQDLTAHAEVNVYRQAQQTLGRNLGACAVYITTEPCVSCAYYLYKGGVGAIFYAASRSDVKSFFRQRSINFEDVLKESGRTMLIVSGIMRDEAVELMTPSNRRY